MISLFSIPEMGNQDGIDLVQAIAVSYASLPRLTVIVQGLDCAKVDLLQRLLERKYCLVAGLLCKQRRRRRRMHKQIRRPSRLPGFRSASAQSEAVSSSGTRACPPGISLLPLIFQEGLAGADRGSGSYRPALLFRRACLCFHRLNPWWGHHGYLTVSFDAAIEGRMIDADSRGDP